MQPLLRAAKTGRHRRDFAGAPGTAGTVLLATFTVLPEWEYGGATVVSALAERGVAARWACWDDPSVDWSAADLVAVRSTWDYHRRLADFLAWARSVDAATGLLNGADVFAWNADKAYLAALAAHVPILPTALLDDHGLAAGLGAALDRWGTVAVKPRVGAGGVGVGTASALDDPRLGGLVAGPRGSCSRSSRRSGRRGRPRCS